MQIKIEKKPAFDGSNIVLTIKVFKRVWAVVLWQV